MSSLSSSFACVQHRTVKVRRECAVDTVTWANDLVRRPQRYGADERTRRIVAELLLEVAR